MATPTPAGNLPTRQQLDEIDALLKRMLTLPPLGREDLIESAAVEAPSSPPPEMTFPTPIIREVPPAHPPRPGDPVVQAWRVQWAPPAAPAPQPSPHAAWGSTVPLATPAEESLPMEPIAPSPHRPAVYEPSIAGSARPPAMSIPTAEPMPESPATNQASVFFLLWPLIGLNVGFNLLTHLLGWPGGWLRGPGRAVMGWLGIGMIATTGVWAGGEWLGYEWPKIDWAQINLSRFGLSR